MALSRAATHKVFTALAVTVIVGSAVVLTIQNRPSPDRATNAGVLATLFEEAERFELATFDLLARNQADEADPDIVFVSIDDQSLAGVRSLYAVGWPWPRTYLGDIVIELKRLGAKLVVLDDIFVEPNTRYPDEDNGFADRIVQAGDVVAGFSFGEEEPKPLRPGRWAVRKGSYATRGAAILAAGNTLSFDATPYLIETGERVEVWLSGYAKQEDAASEANDRLKPLLDLGTKEKPSIRELTLAESPQQVTYEMVFAERNAVEVRGAGQLSIKQPEEIQFPIPQLTSSPMQFGNVTTVPDSDGVVRSMRHVLEHDKRYYPSLAMAAAMRLAGTRDVKFEGGFVRVGDFGAPVDEHGVSIIRYRRCRDCERADLPYHSVPVWNVIKNMGRREKGFAPDRELEKRIKGHIVFVANQAASLNDLKPTPLSKLTVGTLVPAAALDNLLHRDGLLRASANTDSLLALIMALLGALVPVFLMSGSRIRGAVFGEVLATGVILSGYVAWVLRSYQEGTWVAVVLPVGAFMSSLFLTSVWTYVDEARASNVVRDALGRYTNPDLVDEILRNPQYFALEGEQRQLSVLFSDIRDFTTISERMKPRELVNLLNDYLTDMTEVVVKNRGQVDKFIGDAIMAYWGAPLPNRLHAVDACRSAVQMRDALAKRRPAYKQKYGVELVARAGVNTGEMVVGNMGARGAAKRVNYTVMGDAVNLASRLEGTNKVYDTEILIGEGTFEAAREYIEARELDLVRVKGKSRPVRVFELQAMQGQATEAQRALRARFEQALILYRKREFGPALEAFRALEKEFPSDGPSRLYRERCETFLEAPPPEEWDGVFEMKEK